MADSIASSHRAARCRSLATSTRGNIPKMRNNCRTRNRPRRHGPRSHGSHGRAATAATGRAATAATASAIGYLHAAADVLLIQEMERGETDVGHFLFAKNDALIGRSIVRLRDISSGHRGCRCGTQQRKTQSGGTQHRAAATLVVRFCFEACLTRGMVCILRKFL